MIEYKPFKYTLEITKDTDTFCSFCDTPLPIGIYKYYRCIKCHQVLIDTRNQPNIMEEMNKW